MHLLKSSVKVLPSRVMSYYAVAIGRQVGIFDNWQKCEEQIKAYRGARYKKFPTKSAAEEFIREHSLNKNYENPSTLSTLGVNPDIDDYWPSKKEIPERDTFDESGLTDNDLLSALENAESLSKCTENVKRKNEYSYASNKRMNNESKIWEPVGSTSVGDYEFQIDSEGYVIVYTDGSCFNNGRKNASAGYGVYFDDNHPLNKSSPVRGRVTNNVGEIQASIYAIKTAKSLGIKKLCISTDSQFLINSVTMWIKSWKKNNWALKSGAPVKNEVDFKELDSLLSSSNIDVKWNYVAAHKGIKGNEMADRLAREGSETYKSLYLRTFE